MAYTQNNDLRRALEALDIFRVWQVAYAEGQLLSAAPPAGRDGQFPSPFRDDGKRGSFSICHKGRGFQDFGGNGGKGGVWRFAEMCWPSLNSGDLAKKLIPLSGIIETPAPAPATPGTAAAAVDPSVAAAAKSIERRKLEREREDAIYREREDALAVKPLAPPAAWPDCVRDAYLEGVDFLRANPKTVARLAEERGWPCAWASELVDRELISYPWERWATPGEKYAKRHKAFAVQSIKLGRAGTPHGLMTAGYHQRFFVPAEGGRPEKKGWLYVPSLPKSERARISPLERGIVDAIKARGVALEDVRALVPPVPFVIGDVVAPRLIVLLEGQWDAITFFGACGYLFDTAPAELGIAVFGVRGAQGTDAFLSYWGEWLRILKPAAWLIADNDAAGGSWRDAPAAEPGLPRPPSLAERLKHAGARAVTISWLKPGAYGKDFNDYFKATKPTPEKLFAWMRSRGVVDAGGKWA